MIKNCGCNGLIKEIMKEIDQSELSELDSRNISIFLETIAASEPNLIIPILDDVMDYLGSEVNYFILIIICTNIYIKYIFIILYFINCMLLFLALYYEKLYY